MAQSLTPQQLAALKAQWATLERFPIGGELEAKARALVARLHSVALAQIVAVKVKFLQTLAMTELRLRGEVTRDDCLTHAVEVVLEGQPITPGIDRD